MSVMLTVGTILLKFEIKIGSLLIVLFLVSAVMPDSFRLDLDIIQILK